MSGQAVSFSFKSSLLGAHQAEADSEGGDTEASGLLNTRGVVLGWVWDLQQLPQACYPALFVLQTIALLLGNRLRGNPMHVHCLLTADANFTAGVPSTFDVGECVHGFENLSTSDKQMLNTAAVVLLVLYSLELVARCWVHSKNAWSVALLWPLAVYCVSFAIVMFLPVPFYSYIYWTSLRLCDVLAKLEIFVCFARSWKSVLRAITPFLLFMYVSVVIGTTALNLDAVPVQGERYEVTLYASSGLVLGVVPWSPSCQDTPCWKRSYFGTITDGMFSLFQVYTGDSWAEAIVWPSVAYFREQSSLHALMVMVGFAFYIIVTTFIIANFITAVVVDAVSRQMEAEEGIELDKTPRVLSEILQELAEIRARLTNLEAVAAAGMTSRGGCC
mmetsp:Transcript_19772/g.35851  ORF Transcript_19772/g.35851 Transcript_19772/m.35851 type:complete len:388 (-) Transcript_19772:35-1198(-)